MTSTHDTKRGRTAQKRDAIVSEATTIFLRNGFLGTSMDEIAAAAAVSKQTVYKQFGDKESLFREIVDGVSQNSDAIVARITAAFEPDAIDDDALRRALRTAARSYLESVLQARVLSLRRLIIAEAERFPDLALRYYERAPARGIAVLSQCLQPFIDSGVLKADNPRTAAAHFAYLSLSIAQDRALFIPTDLPTDAERERLADAAVRAFVDGYRARA